MRTIELTQGQRALVDDLDFESLASVRWYAQRTKRAFYAARRVRDLSVSHGQRVLYMHRVIMQAADGLEVDHIDGDALNNQRSNLRIVTSLQNQHNRTRKQIGASSRFRGVCWNQKSQRWQAGIQIAGRSIHLGLFDQEWDAALAYNAAGFARDPEHFTPNKLEAQP